MGWSQILKKPEHPAEEAGLQSAGRQGQLGEDFREVKQNSKFRKSRWVATTGSTGPRVRGVGVGGLSASPRTEGLNSGIQIGKEEGESPGQVCEANFKFEYKWPSGSMSIN